METSDEVISELIKQAETVLSDGLLRFPNDHFLLTEEAAFGSILSDHERARTALEKAVSVSTRNTAAVSRLVRIYSRSGNSSAAQGLLTRALDNAPNDMRLHWVMAQLLRDADGDPLAVEAHLRQSFTEGDRNLDAQFWYARQLYINGKVSDSKKYFQVLSRARMTPAQRREVRGIWQDKGANRRFTGRVAKMELSHAVIDRDGANDRIFLPRSPSSEPLWKTGGTGLRVQFSLGFNAYGAVAVDVRAE